LRPPGAPYTGFDAISPGEFNTTKLPTHPAYCSVPQKWYK
jgi:hypothetical protein